MADPKAKVIIDADAEGVLREANKATRALQGLSTNIRDSFRQGAAQSGSFLTDLAEKAGSVFGALKNPLVLAAGGIAAVGAAAVKAGAAALNYGRRFETAMANVSTLVDTNVVDMGKLGNQVLALGVKLGRPPEQLAAALYEFVSAGGDVTKGLGDFEVAVRGSIAGVTDAKVAVDGLTTIMNTYGKEAGSAMNVSDLMFQTVNKGKITFEELSQEIGLVAATAKGADVPLAELMAAIATATAQGIRPSSAMEGLRSAISNIIKPSAAAQETAKVLGIQWGLAALKAKGLAGLLKDVRDKTKGNTEAMAQLFGDVSGLNVVLALTGEGAGMFADNLTLMENAGGSTDEAFRKQKSTFDEVANGLSAIGDAALAAIYNKFRPYLVGAGQWIIDNWPDVSADLSATGKVLSDLTTLGLIPFKAAWDGLSGLIATVANLLSGDFKGAAEAAQTAVSNLSTDLGTFKGVWENIQIPDWVTALGSAAVTLAATKLAMAGLVPVITALSEGLFGLAAAIEGLSVAGFLGAIGKMITGLLGAGGLTAALGDLWAALSLAGEAIAGAGSAILAAIPIWGWIALAVVAAAGVIWANWDAIGPWWSRTWEGMKQAASDGATSIHTFLTETAPKWAAAAVDWTKIALADLVKWFADLPGNIANGVAAVGQWLDEQIPKWGYAFGKMLGDALVAIIDWFLKLGENIAKSVGFAAGWLSVEIPKWAAAFTKWLSDSLTAITDWFVGLPKKIEDGIAVVGTFLTKTIPEKWTAFKDWLADFETNLVNFFTGLPDRFVAWIRNVVDAISGLLDAFKEKGRQLAQAIWDGMKESVEGFFTSIPGRVKGIVDKAVDGFNKGRAAAGGDGIPQYGTGTIVDSPTLAVIGEGGEPEAVVPRSRAADFLPTILGWAGAMGDMFSSFSTPALAVPGGGSIWGGASFNLTVNIVAPAGTTNPRAWGAAAGDALYDKLARNIKL